MFNNDNKMMESGVRRLLGQEPHDSSPMPEDCEHEDDGFIYGSTPTRQTLHCIKCLEFYDKPK